MVANSIQKKIAVALETGSLAAPAVIDYDAIAAPGGLMAVTEWDDAALKRAYVENETLRRRATDKPVMLQALRSDSNVPLSFYMSGQTSGHAAAGSPALPDLLAMFLQAAWGGEYLGVSTTVTGGTAALPEVTEAEGIGLGPFGWGYFWDLDGGPLGNGAGYFRQIASVASPGGGPDVLTMAADHALPFTPAAGDLVHAVIATYVDEDIASDYTDPANALLRILAQGRIPTDLYELYGAKPSIEVGPIEQGVRTQFSAPTKCAYFLHNELAITPSLSQALQGAPGQTVGAGTTTTAYLSNAGIDLTSQQFWGAIGVTTGIEPEQVKGPNGTEGVHGYGLTEGSYSGTQLEIMVPFDVQFRTDAEAGTEKRFMIQVGNAITSGPWAVYCPRLAWMDDVEAGAEGNARRQQTLRFDALEARRDGETGAVDLTGLTAAQEHRALSKITILRIA